MKKSIVIHFGRNNSHFQYFINSSLLKTSERVKDLGIIVDARLKFAEHLKLIKSKCFKIINLIYKNFRIRDFHFYCKLYKIRVGFQALCLRFRARPARNCQKLSKIAKN